MPYALIAQGSVNDLATLDQYRVNFPEGSEGYLELELSSPVAVEVVNWLDGKLESVGVPRSRVEVRGNSLLIYFKTEVAPLVLIAGAIALSLVLLAVIVAWKLFKLSPVTVIGLSVGLVLAVIAAVVAIAILGKLVVGGVRIGK